jgi:hypothetical protein
MCWIVVLIIVAGVGLIAFSVVNPLTGLFLILAGTIVTAFISDRLDRKRRSGLREVSDLLPGRPSDLLNPGRPFWPGDVDPDFRQIDAAELDPASGGTPWGEETDPPTRD